MTQVAAIRRSRNRLAFLFAIVVLIVVAVPGRTADYQFGAEFPPSLNDPLFPNKSTAFLWVPPHIRELRAVLLAPANIIERRITDDPLIRAEAARDGIALLFFQAGWAKAINGNPRLAQLVQEMLDRFSDESGYSELRKIPWIPLGHSGNSQFCAAIARQRPDRVLANIIIKGAFPDLGPDNSNIGIRGIPILFFTGQFEEVMPPGNVRDAWWDVQMKRFLTVKSVVPDALASGMEDRSHGHIHWLPEMSGYLALYLHKAMQARLSGDPPQLRAVAYANGWLGDPDDHFPSAPVATYKGDAKSAFWFFDEEQARAWKVLFDRDRGKKDQMLAFTQDGVVAPWWNGWGLQSLKFEPLPDGVSFKVHAQFRDQVPEPFADAGTKLGRVHAI